VHHARGPFDESFHFPGWRLAAIVLVGLNLRPALAAIGPLLDMIQRATGIADGAASLLTTIPILLMGAGALGARSLQRAVGCAAGVWLGVVLIALACASRIGAQHAWLLLASAGCAGLGIAMVQALLPAFVKTHFPTRIGGAMGIYSTSIMGGAVLASVVAPLAAARWDWPMALAGWALPAAVAALVWPLASRGGDVRGAATGLPHAAQLQPSRSPRVAARAVLRDRDGRVRRSCSRGCRRTTCGSAGRRRQPAVCSAA
jgi:CP family cyanate transporter-like MFS transporter